MNHIFNIIIILIVLLILLIFFLRQYKKWKNQIDNYEWPLDVNKCPDYWKYDNNGALCSLEKSNKHIDNFPKCLNDNNLKNSDKNTWVANLSKLNPIDKCKWAKKCSIAWDGITNKC